MVCSLGCCPTWTVRGVAHLSTPSSATPDLPDRHKVAFLSVSGQLDMHSGGLGSCLGEREERRVGVGGGHRQSLDISAKF